MKIELKRKNLIEIIILGAVALGCLFYIGFRERGKINYTLPSFPVIATDEFTALEILSPQGETVRMEKEGSRWLLSDGYPAEPATVNRLLDALEQLTPVDLVSESENYGRYELDEARRYTLKGYKRENLVREIHLGKPSSSENYNYVLFPGNRNVYTLRGALIKTARREPENFRDKVVLELNRSAILGIDYAATGQHILLSKGADDGWSDQDGNPWEPQKIQEILGRFTSLRAVDFPAAPPAEGSEIAVITLKGEKESTLTLFEKGDGGYPALSSDYPFPVLLSEYTGDAILSGFGRD